MKVERSSAVRATARRSQTTAASAASGVGNVSTNQQPPPGQPTAAPSGGVPQQQQLMAPAPTQQQLAVPDLSSLNPVPGSQFLIPSSQLGAYQTATPVSSVSGQALTAGPGQQLMQTSTGQILQMSMNEMPSQRLIRRGHQMELMGQAKVLYDNQDFVDLTIYCEDGVVRAHQMLLAVASPFLFGLFQANPCYGTEDITLILPEVKACLVQALIHFVYTGVVVSGEDHFYSIMKLVYALNINASIEAESTNDRATTFNAPLVPPHLLGAVLKLPHMTAAAAAPLAHQQQSQLNNSFNTSWGNTSGNTTGGGNFQPLLPQQPVPPMSINGSTTTSSNVNSIAAAAVAAITQPAIAPPNLVTGGGAGNSLSGGGGVVGGPPSAKMARLSGPPASAMPVPLSNLTGVTTAGGAAGPTATSSIGGPSAAGSAAELPIQLPAQPVPMVNGVVKGTEHSQIITASSMAGGSMATLGGGGVLTQTQAGTSSQQLSATGQLGGGQPVNPGGGQPQVTSQPPTQQYIAIDPTTGINYKVDMALTAGDLAGSGPLAAIMNETIFQDTSGAIVPAPNAQIYQTDSGQVIYTTQPPPNATGTIPTGNAIQIQGAPSTSSSSGAGQPGGAGQSGGPGAPLGASTPVSSAKKGGGSGGGSKKRSAKDAGLNNNTSGSLGGAAVAAGSPSTSSASANASALANSTAPASLLSLTPGTPGGAGGGANNESVDDLPCTPDDEDINTPYPCPTCNKTIKGKVMLQAHHFQEHYVNQELQAMDVGDKHACRVCLKLFTRNSDVKAHILRVHCGDRRYPCTMCGKRFKESTHLRKHLYTHTGERPHCCSLCSKGFQTSSDLKRHKRTRVHQERVEQGGGIEPDDVIVSTAPIVPVDHPASTVSSAIVSAPGSVSLVGGSVTTAPAVTAKKSNGAIVVTAGPPSIGQDLSTSGTRWSEDDDDLNPTGHAGGGSSGGGGHTANTSHTAQALLCGITEPVPVPAGVSLGSHATDGQLIVPTTVGTNAARENELIAASTSNANSVSNSNNAVGANSTPLDLEDITAEFMDEPPSANSSAANVKNEILMPDLAPSLLDHGHHLSAPLPLVGTKTVPPPLPVGSSLVGLGGSGGPTSDEGDERLTVVEGTEEVSQDSVGPTALLTNSRKQ